MARCESVLHLRRAVGLVRPQVRSVFALCFAGDYLATGPTQTRDVPLIASPVGPHVDRVCRRVVALKKCGHLFCRECLEQWLAQSKNNAGMCPTCRQRCASRSSTASSFC